MRSNSLWAAASRYAMQPANVHAHNQRASPARRYHSCYNSADTIFLVMEYCQGSDLGRWIKEQESPLSEETVLSCFAQVALALQHIHQQGIIHRDLKTANVFIAKDGSIKIGDFGICRVLQDGGEVRLKLWCSQYLVLA